MVIRFRCHQCGKSFTVKIEYAGKKAKCPCGAKIVIPADNALAKPSVERTERKMAVGAAQDTMEQKRKSNTETIPKHGTAQTVQETTQPSETKNRHKFIISYILRLVVAGPLFAFSVYCLFTPAILGIGFSASLLMISVGLLLPAKIFPWEKTPSEKKYMIEEIQRERIRTHDDHIYRKLKIGVIVFVVFTFVSGPLLIGYSIKTETNHPFTVPIMVIAFGGLAAFAIALAIRGSMLEKDNRPSDGTRKNNEA